MSVKTILGLGALAVLAIPPAVFLWAALASGLPLGESLTALTEQYAERKQNLLVCGMLGLFPLGLLAVVLLLMWRFAPAGKTRPAVALGGLAPVLAVLLWINVGFWTLFLPSRTYPGFPHGLEFVIGPGFFAPAAMSVGMLIGWLAARRVS